MGEGITILGASLFCVLVNFFKIQVRKTQN